MTYTKTGKESRNRTKYIKALSWFLIIMGVLTILSRAADSLTIAVAVGVSPTPGVLTHSSAGDGTVEAADEQHISTRKGLRIKDIFVKEGERVEAGAPVAEMDIDEILENIQNCRLEIDKYKMDILLADYEGSKAVDDSALEAVRLKLERLKEDNDMAEEAMQREMMRLTDDMYKASENVRKAEQKLREVKEEGYDDLLKACVEAVEEAEKNLKQAEKDQSKALTAAKRAINDAINNMAAASGGEADSIKMSYQNEVRRANRDYDDTVAEWKENIKKAKEKLEEAQTKLKEAEDGGIEGLKTLEGFDYSVVENAINGIETAHEAVTSMQRSVEDATSDHRTRSLNASRAAEDAMTEAAKQEKNIESANKDKEMNALKLNIDKKTAELGISNKQKELAALSEIYEAGGIIYAPASGVVGKIYVQPGGVTDGGRLMSLRGEVQNLIFKTKLDTKDTEYMKPGDEVKVTLRGSQKPIEGAVIQSIEALTGEDSGMSEIKVSLPEDSGLLPGAAASFEHEFKTSQFAMTLPTSAVRGSNKDRYVLVATETETVLGKETTLIKIPVDVEDEDKTKAAVKGNIGRTDIIVSGSSKPVEEGDRVRFEPKDEQ